MRLQDKVILCIGGHDPSACAGLAADARMIEWLGGRAVTLASCLTSQSRTHFESSQTVDVAMLQQQWHCLRADMPIHGIKIGALASPDQAQWAAQLIEAVKVPVVLDPVIRSSAGHTLGDSAALKSLLDSVDLVTPNSLEARILGLDRPPRPSACLITASDDSDAEMIQHQLWQGQNHQVMEVRRRPGQYRGSGCILASAICAHLVAGFEITQACSQSLQLVDLWLKHAWRFDDDIHLPRPPRS